MYDAEIKLAREIVQGEKKDAFRVFLSRSLLARSNVFAVVICSRFDQEITDTASHHHLSWQSPWPSSRHAGYVCWPEGAGTSGSHLAKGVQRASKGRPKVMMIWNNKAVAIISFLSVIDGYQ